MPSFLLAALSTLALLTADAPAAVATPPVTEPHFDSYVTSDGTRYFAVSLAPNVPLNAAASRDVVILFDTSASQISVFRERGLEALTTLLADLPRGDRARLMAVDLEAVPLTTSFVSPQSEEMTKAVEALKQRVPLGATDMPAVLNAAVASFDVKSATANRSASSARALIYIGDGQSAANFLTTAEYRKLLEGLLAARVPVSSLGIGPRVDSALLASMVRIWMRRRPACFCPRPRRARSCGPKKPPGPRNLPRSIPHKYPRCAAIVTRSWSAKPPAN
jgi:hypothetical protein